MKQITVGELVDRLSAREIISNVEIIGTLDHHTLARVLEYDERTDEWFCRERFILRDCKIERVDLRSITFENQFELRKCVIHYAVFTGAKFNKGVNFSTTEFLASPTFSRTWFFWTAYFSDTVFHDGASFSFAFFKEWAFFHSAKFVGKADFSSTSFEKRALFGKIDAAEIDFGNSRFYDVFSMSTAEANGSNLEVLLINKSRIFGSLDLSGVRCVALCLADMKCTGPINLREAKFDKLDLTDASYAELDVDIDQIFPRKDTYSKLIVKGGGASSIKNLKTVYTRLKVNYQTMGMRDEEDEMYRRLRGAEAQAKRENGSYLKYCIDKYVLDLLFGYGTMPSRAFGSSVLVVLVYALLYISFGITRSTPGLWEGNFSPAIAFDSLYFSCITFTTIGYGDISPAGVARLLAASEGFIGVFMMGAFSVTFARKLLR